MFYVLCKTPTKSSHTNGGGKSSHSIEKTNHVILMGKLIISY